jgi:hypothetical protein
MRIFWPALTLFLLFAFSSGLYAQRRCATVEYQQLNRASGKVFETDEQFEKALAEKIRARKKNPLLNLSSGVPYRIPVVVHVIHNGEAEGVGRNIPDAQIISQIDVLNKDFNRLNTDAINTPADFAGVAGNLNVEFVLARQDPDGQPTDGIMRIDGNRDQWSLALEDVFKALHPAPGNSDNDYTDYWPPEDYLNIWVIKFTGFLGYAQFPVSSGLPGLEDENNNRLTDGVILDYRVFGTDDAGSFDLYDQYNKGRSTTHEVGHFLGLRHVWGDDNGCAESDYADDTPNQGEETYNTPVHPLEDDCSPAIMFQNYMDYTDDVSMNLFTLDQVERMIVVLENSPRRASLSSSHGLEEPVPGDIDAGILEIENPVAVVCDQTPDLRFTVANLSDEAITSMTVKLTINSIVTEAEVSFTGAPFTTLAEVTVSAINLGVGDNSIGIKITGINGMTDPNPANNELETSVTVLNPECTTFALYTNEAGTPVITFDLSEPMPVEISVMDMVGRQTARVQHENILNQTVPLPLPARMKAVYIVRLKIGTRYYSRKVYLYP